MMIDSYLQVSFDKRYHERDMSKVNEEIKALDEEIEKWKKTEKALNQSLDRLKVRRKSLIID